MTEDRASRYRREDEIRIKNFRLIDDDFMKMVFDDNIEATELVLNVIFDRYDMKVLHVKSQNEIKNVNGRSVRFDVYAIDSEGHHYDIEIQRSDHGAGERRARFNSSMLDTKLLIEGQQTKELPDTYIIFITEHDIRGQGRPIYWYERFDRDTHEPFSDGSHIIYVNGAYKNNESRIGRLMHDFRCTDADDMNHPALAEKVRYFKETEGGHGTMCKAIEEMRNEVRMEAHAEGLAEGLAEGMVEGERAAQAAIVRQLLKKGSTVDAISDLLEMPVDAIKALIDLPKTE